MTPIRVPLGEYERTLYSRIFQGNITSEELRQEITQASKYSLDYSPDTKVHGDEYDYISQFFKDLVEEDVWRWSGNWVSLGPVEQITWPLKEKDPQISRHEWVEPYIDGHSQVSWYLGDLQTKCYYDDFFVRFLVADAEGGIALLISPYDHSLKFYQIGEDDGSWFLIPAQELRKRSKTNRFVYLKRKLLSEINDTVVKGLNSQRVIGDLFNLKEFTFESWNYDR